jgi:hypothetical protein
MPELLRYERHYQRFVLRKIVELKVGVDHDYLIRPEFQVHALNLFKIFHELAHLVIYLYRQGPFSS